MSQGIRNCGIKGSIGELTASLSVAQSSKE